jgi:hypothetical protein
LYHANTVRWLNEYGTPPGLASLHGRLGMNSIWLVLSALFDNAYWDNRVAWIMGGLLFSCTVAYLLYNTLFITRRAIRLFCGAMLFFVFIHGARNPNLYYDLPALWINMMVFTECLVCAENGWRMTPGQASISISLAALAFTIKPMTGITLLFVTVAALYGLRKNHCLAIGHTCRAFAPAMAACIVWMARNTLLSGYPLFPLSLFPLPMDWTLPKELVVTTVYEIIIASARKCSVEFLHTWDWVVPWLERHLKWWWFWCFAGLPLLMAVPLWGKTLCRRKNMTPVFFLAWSASSLFYWFFTAPDLRFGAAFFQIFFALGLAFALRQSAWLASCEAYGEDFLQNRQSCVLMSALGFLFLIVLSASIWTFHSTNRSLFYIGSIPAATLSSRELDTSVTPPILLFFPTNGDALCGNSPIPCAPYDDPRLRLRVPGDLGGGFYIK